MSKADFRPLLAATLIDPETVKFPIMVSPKLDGIRCLIYNGVAVSRNLKPIRNQFIQEKLKGLPNGLDGELIVGDPADKLVYRTTSSGVMREAGEPDFTFYIFDSFTMQGAFKDRFATTSAIVHTTTCKHAKLLKQGYVTNVADMLMFEDRALEEGFEGIMVRSLEGPYKQGRSTLNEGTLMKFKRFVDGEFLILGCTELMKNANELTKDELGYAKRSTSKDGKVPMDTLGSLTMQTREGKPFSCGSGFDPAERALLWAQRETLAGSWGKVKYFAVGGYDVPRFPVWLGFSDSEF